MNAQICLLSDDELEAVSGGIDCGTALAVSKVYSTVGDIISTFGGGNPVASVGAAYMTGLATGVLQGAFPA